jgi:hypothetical protein
MIEPKKHFVTALTQALVAEDASYVEVHLTAADEPLVLSISANSLSRIVSRLTDLETAVQMQIGSTTGHVATAAADVSAVMVQEAVGGKRVIVSFRSSTGRIHSFALSVEQVQQLRVDAWEAEDKAKEQASRSRN